MLIFLDMMKYMEEKLSFSNIIPIIWCHTICLLRSSFNKDREAKKKRKKSNQIVQWLTNETRSRWTDKDNRIKNEQHEADLLKLIFATICRFADWN